MKISAVQLRPITGDIEANIVKHRAFIQEAVAQGADVVFFPELSLTGFEPRLARSLATEPTDARLDVFQHDSDQHHIIIGVGLPTVCESGVQIGMVWFVSNAPRRSYAKQQLHADEYPFFVAGDRQLILEQSAHKLAPAICYESLQPSHAENAANLGVDSYLVSVAKSASGMAKAMAHYPEVARQHQMHVVMADSVGPCDDFISVGQSAVWTSRGDLLLQMDSESEGIVMLDTATETASLHLLQVA